MFNKKYSLKETLADVKEDESMKSETSIKKLSQEEILRMVEERKNANKGQQL